MPSCHKMRKDRPQNVRFHFMLPSHCALEEWFNFIPLCFFQGPKNNYLVKGQLVKSRTQRQVTQSLANKGQQFPKSLTRQPTMLASILPLRYP